MTPPPDFAAKREAMTLAQLKVHYATSLRTVRKWVKALELAPKTTAARHVLPADFATTAPAMHKKAMMIHYGVSQRVIDRWLCEAGVLSRPAKGTYFKLTPLKTPDFITKRVTPEDLAADYLRRFMAVSRRSVCGKHDPKGPLWLAGTVLCNDDELVAKADRMKSRRMENV